MKPKTPKTLTASCRYCGKVIYSMWETQLTYNHFAHETACKVRPKGELHPAVVTGDASRSIPEKQKK